MPRFSDLNRQIDALMTGRELPPQTDTLSAVVNAIEGLRAVMDSEERDYSEAFNALGNAVAKALRTHGNDLVKAIAGITVNVEAPVVNVAAPNVTCNPEFELNMPEIENLYYRIDRDRDGVMLGVAVGKREMESREEETAAEFE